VRDGPIVVGVDGSASANRALTWARDTAARRGLALRIVQAESGQHPAEVLIAASDEASTVVIGHRGHGGFHDMLLGSTSLHTAMHARCPVAVVRPFATSPQTIVVGVDGSDYSECALEYAFTEADLTRYPIVAVNAWQGDITAGSMGLPYVYDPIDRQNQAEKLLAETLEPWRDRYPGVTVHTEVVQLPASAALVERSYGAYLAVVGCRGLGGFTGMLLGSVGQALIHHAGSPVLIAHSGQ
jgi:nucleotide-binding universal stress UspA family protein